MDNPQQLHHRIEELTKQVLLLQKKLDDIHSTDVNSLRRAYKTLTQHIQALEIETKEVLPTIKGIQTDIVSPREISSELTAMFIVAGEVWGVHQLLGLTRPFLSRLRWLGPVAVSLGIGYIAWRLSQRVLHGMTTMVNSNRWVKATLMREWAEVEQRVSIMVQLLDWKPQATSITAEALSPHPAAYGSAQLPTATALDANPGKAVTSFPAAPTSGLIQAKATSMGSFAEAAPLDSKAALAAYADLGVSGEAPPDGPSKQHGAAQHGTAWHAQHREVPTAPLMTPEQAAMWGLGGTAQHATMQ